MSLREICKRKITINYKVTKKALFKYVLFNVMYTKLDGVGPVDNRPATDKLHHFVKKK